MPLGYSHFSEAAAFRLFTYHKRQPTQHRPITPFAVCGCGGIPMTVGHPTTRKEGGHRLTVRLIAIFFPSILLHSTPAHLSPSFVFVVLECLTLHPKSDRLLVVSRTSLVIKKEKCARWTSKPRDGSAAAHRPWRSESI